MSTVSTPQSSSTLTVGAEHIRGLSSAEAVARRARGEGNEGPPPTFRTYRTILRENVFTFINNVLFLLGAALVALGEWTDAVVAVGVIAGNILVSVVQEIRAKRTLDRIALLTRPQATVLRDGVEQTVPADQIVRGDILAARPGDQIVADGALVSSAPIDLDESLLSGESEPVTKSEGGTLSSGSFCVRGAGFYRAEGVGLQSFANTLTARARTYRRVLTPLQREVNVIIRIIFLVAALFEVLLLAQTPILHLSLVEGVKMALVIAKLVPAGLFLSITLAYALGAVNAARRGVVIQQINAVESLSNVDVLCLDKTGTLTANRLAVRSLLPLDISEDDLRERLGDFAASTSAGNRTTQAIAGSCRGTARQVLAEVPFSSIYKWSALSFAGGGSYVLGAPDVLARTVRLPASAERQIDEWNGQGLRVLLFCNSRDESVLEPQRAGPSLPAGLRPLGLVSLSDELRPEARETLDHFVAAGVRPKIISGDHPQTVAALATQAGLGPDLRVMSGAELAELEPAQLVAAAEETDVFGRISPDQKEQLVAALKEGGHYVAMIGDGVNDVLSLKGAHLSVAMESGTQAARGIADIVLLGDSFAALPHVVVEGQRIHNGLRDILKLFITRVLAVSFMLMGVMTLGGFPFEPKHISVLTTLTVGIPSVALALWSRPGPAPPGSVARSLVHFVVPAALTMALAGLAVYEYVVLTTDDLLPVGAQTAITVLAVPCGLLLLPFLAPPTNWWTGGNPLSGDWRPTILAGLLFVSFAVLMAIAPLRTFFDLTSISQTTLLAVAGIVAAWTITLRITWRARLLERFLGIDL